VPTTAQPGDVVKLDATATDLAGNSTDAAQVLLPVGDTVAANRVDPDRVRPAGDGAGPHVRVLVGGEDGLALARLEITALARSR